MVKCFRFVSLLRRTNCQKIGYAPRVGKKSVNARDSEDRGTLSCFLLDLKHWEFKLVLNNLLEMFSYIVDTSPDYNPRSASSGKRTVASRSQTPTAAPSFKTPTVSSEKFKSRSNVNEGGEGSVKDSKVGYYVSSENFDELGSSSKSNKRAKPQGARAVEVINSDDDDSDSSSERIVTEFPEKVGSLLLYIPYLYAFPNK